MNLSTNEILQCCIEAKDRKGLVINIIKPILNETDHVKRWAILETVFSILLRAEMKILSSISKKEIEKDGTLFSGFYLFRALLMYNLSRIMDETATQSTDEKL